MAISVQTIGEGDDAVHFAPTGLMYGRIRHRYGSRTEEQQFFDGSTRLRQDGPRVPGIEVTGALSGKGTIPPGAQAATHAALTTLMDKLKPLVGTVQPVTFRDNIFFDTTSGRYSVDSLDVDGEDYLDMAAQTIRWVLRLSVAPELPEPEAPPPTGPTPGGDEGQ